MTVHTGWKSRKVGLFEKQIIEAKRLRVVKNLDKIKPGVDLAELNKAIFAAKRLRFSEHGDFTNCYRGGFY